MKADGGNGFDNDLEFDTFGWSYRYVGTDGSPAGFMLTGDPQSTDPNWTLGGDPIDGTNTYFGPPSLCSPDEATGLLTQDQWYIEDPTTPANDGCYFFGGYSNNNGCGGPASPYASFSLKIFASELSCPGDNFFCSSNRNSTGVNSFIVATGSLSISANNLTLVASRLPPHVVGFFLTSQTFGFTTNPGGSAGNLCLGGSIGRFQQNAMSSGNDGLIRMGTQAGQWSLSSIPQGTGTYAAVAGDNSIFQLWHRDSSTAGPTSNFTDGFILVWQP